MFAAALREGSRGMDEARYIDWYDVVQAVANGRQDGHACPECGASGLEATSDAVEVRVRCPACGEGFAGRLAHGRDDGFFAEADAMIARRQRGRASAPVDRAALVAGGVCASGSHPDAVALMSTPGGAIRDGQGGSSEPAAPPTRPDPWTWTLPAEGGDDLDSLSQWMPVVESIHNGRAVGLRCPFCSEPLTDITHQPPHIRVRCAVCGEAFEGRLG